MPTITYLGTKLTDEHIRLKLCGGSAEYRHTQSDTPEILWLKQLDNGDIHGRNVFTKEAKIFSRHDSLELVRELPETGWCNLKDGAVYTSICNSRQGSLTLNNTRVTFTYRRGIDLTEADIKEDTACMWEGNFKSIDEAFFTVHALGRVAISRKLALNHSGGPLQLLYFSSVIGIWDSSDRIFKPVHDDLTDELNEVINDLKELAA